MTSRYDIQVEGVTVFAASPTTFYRYILGLKSDKLSIWMENRTSKEQWYKGEIAKDDYITSANIISDASPMDYLQCFQDSLNSELNRSGDVQRTLERMPTGALRLQINVKFRILRSSRVVKYAFVLDPLPVERIDVLESKLRDQQDELERINELESKLRDQQDELERLRRKVDARNAHIELKALVKHTTTLNALWSYIQSVTFSVNDTTGLASIFRSGLYSVTAAVNAGAHRSDQLIRLMKNETCVQKADIAYHGYYYVTTLSTSIWLHANGVVTVKCGVTVKEAFLSIALL
ncbi:hypothetical protein PsorP6_002936 [Peronosclerospora sorghi]|uniref:Uncharacterized protein n=1 Tax=Peronosclerospora sorghi TaxID=230839 RepID=A0ACC0VJL7_9STRA|nr:hypothetical protein PsorP6_002936 [Peronosclerospora sorghi]